MIFSVTIFLKEAVLTISKMAQNRSILFCIIVQNTPKKFFFKKANFSVDRRNIKNYRFVQNATSKLLPYLEFHLDLRESLMRLLALT